MISTQSDAGHMYCLNYSIHRTAEPKRSSQPLIAAHARRVLLETPAAEQYAITPPRLPTPFRHVKSLLGLDRCQAPYGAPAYYQRIAEHGPSSGHGSEEAYSAAAGAAGGASMAITLEM